MITYTNKKEIMDIYTARKEKGKSLFVITDDTNISNLVGYIYATSTEISTLDELIDLSCKLEEQGLQTIIIGEYTHYLISMFEYRKDLTEIELKQGLLFCKIVEMISKEDNCTLEEANTKFLGTKVFENLLDSKSGLFDKSVDGLWSMYLTELGTNI